MSELETGDEGSSQSDKIELLYKYYGILADSKENISQHLDIYKEILKATKGNANEKKLACQFIPRFFSQFPSLGDEALNAHFDLCEDSDLSIRKQAIKELGGLCRECPENTRRVSDILAQLLQATEPSELAVVRSSLLALFKIQPKAALVGIFNQIKNGDDRVREKCIDFIMTRVRELPVAIFTPEEVQDVLICETKAVLQDASYDEIPVFFDLLLWTRLGKTIAGKKEILKVIIEQLEAEKNLNTDDEYLIERLLIFFKMAKRLFSAEVNSNEFLVYFCEEVVPKFNSITGCEEGSGNALEVLKLLSEISCFVKDLKNTSVLDAVFSLLLEYLPSPSKEDETPHHKLQFSYVECLLSTLHHLLKGNPEYLLSGSREKLKDFRIKLQYFARVSQVYVKTLEEIIKKNKNDPDDSETKIKVMALKTISNINILIKDFFHNPPMYKSTIQLSWMSVGQEKQQPLKRKPSSEGPRIEKQMKPNRSFHQGIYQPPNGKYSSSLFGAR